MSVLSEVETGPAPPMLRVNFDGCTDCSVTLAGVASEKTYTHDLMLKVEFCPMHAAAQELLAALRGLLDAGGYADGEGPWAVRQADGDVVAVAETAIAKAEPKAGIRQSAGKASSPSSPSSSTK